MSTPRIMIVDDDTTIRSLLVSTLPTDGYELLEARGGSEAIELLLTKPPDLVLLDWKMPGPLRRRGPGRGEEAPPKRARDRPHRREQVVPSHPG